MANEQAAPVATAPVAPVTPVTEKKSGHGCLYLFLGCGALLLLCCCISVVIGIFAPNAALKMLAGANSGPDITLTRIQADELVAAQGTLNNSLTSQTDTTASVVTIRLTEKDVITLFFADILGTKNIDKVGVKISPNKAKVQLELKALLDISAQQASDSTTVAPTTSPDANAALAGIYMTITLGVGSDGKSVTVTDMSTGNTIIDGFIPADLKQQIGDQIAADINEGFSSGLSSDTSGVTLEKITFVDGIMELTFSQK